MFIKYIILLKHKKYINRILTIYKKKISDQNTYCIDEFLMESLFVLHWYINFEISNGFNKIVRIMLFHIGGEREDKL